MRWRANLTRKNDSGLRYPSTSNGTAWIHRLCLLLEKVKNNYAYMKSKQMLHTMWTIIYSTFEILKTIINSSLSSTGCTVAHLPDLSLLVSALLFGIGYYLKMKDCPKTSHFPENQPFLWLLRKPAHLETHEQRSKP